MRGLYPIVDLDALQKVSNSPQKITEFAQLALSVRPALLQLRAKHAGARETLALLRALRPLCTATGTHLIANDRPDLAILAECDGVHVGQEDLPLAVVRELGPKLLVGVSTHDPEQLIAALAEKPDYVAFGPVYGTVSKERPDPTVGLAGLIRAHEAALAHGIPLVAIGGIDLARAAEIHAHCELGAVIGALLPEPNSLSGVGEAARALHRALGGDES